VSNSRKLTLKEKIQIFNKRTKKNTIKQPILIIVILVVMLIGARYQNSYSVEDTKMCTSSNENFKLNCIFVGDITFNRTMEDITDKKGYDYLFRNVDSMLKAADYVSCNFESAITSKPVKKDSFYYANKYAAKGLKFNKFTVVSLANDHVLDYGLEGLKDTVYTLNESNLPFAGANITKKEAENYNMRDINGIKVATLGFNDIKSNSKGGVLECEPETFLRLIQNANKKADLVIVNCHWGEEYETKQSSRQEKFARAMVDAGADIVIGHHPHVLQPIEIYKDSLICYSLGNFIFDQGWSRTKDSALVNYKLNENGIGEISILPIRIEEGTPAITSNKYFSKRIFNELTLGVKKEQYVIKENTLVVKLNNTRALTKKKEKTEVNTNLNNNKSNIKENNGGDKEGKEY